MAMETQLKSRSSLRRAGTDANLLAEVILETAIGKIARWQSTHGNSASFPMIALMSGTDRQHYCIEFMT
jgi:hypothetical protein